MLWGLRMLGEDGWAPGGTGGRHSASSEALPALVSHRPLLARSWRRSAAHGAGRDGAHLPLVRAAGDGLQLRRGRNPVRDLLPVLHSLLDDGVSAVGGVFAVADVDGTLLWIGGDRAALRRIARINFVEGADWSETSVGTNAPGTALVTGRAVQVVGSEHYNESVRSWSCAAAPVRDPDTGKVVAAIDITARRGLDGPLALTLAQATARSLEGDLLHRLERSDERAREAFGRFPRRASSSSVLLSPGGRVLCAAPSLHLGSRVHLPQQPPGELLVGGRRAEVEPVGDGYLLVQFLDAQAKRGVMSGRPLLDASVGLRCLGTDTATLTVGEQVVRLSPRHSEIVVLLASTPAGMSAGRLAIELSPGDRSTTSIRAEMCRLRTLLGGLLDSQPYRLCRDVHADFTAVRDLLSAGRLAEALGTYRGPLLPNSEAPGIVDQRLALDQQMRGALLACADPMLLRSWVDQPWGRDDLGAWAALARALPGGSPQQASALHRARGLEREFGLSGATPLQPRRP